MSPRWALIVGGSRGLGAACAEALARRGYAIALTYHSNVDAAETVRTLLSTAGAPWVRTLAMDLADPLDCEHSVQGLLDEFGPPQCLVHSAASLLRASLAETDTASFAQNLTVNCTSAYAISRVVGLAMQQAGTGSITLLSSVIGRLGVRDRVAYGTSKAGLIGMAKCLAVDLAPAVRVNAIVLGTFDTDMNDGLRHDEVALAALVSRVPLSRLGKANEVGSVVAFLADSATFVTGAAWEIDGGTSARLATPSGDPLPLTSELPLGHSKVGAEDE